MRFKKKVCTQFLFGLWSGLTENAVFVGSLEFFVWLEHGMKFSMLNEDRLNRRFEFSTSNGWFSKFL